MTDWVELNARSLLIAATYKEVGGPLIFEPELHRQNGYFD